MNINFPGPSFNARSFRLFMETEVERLIAVLDAMDGDADFEDAQDPDIEDEGDFEPSLGWSRSTGAVLNDESDDREHDDSDMEDGADDELSFGAQERHPSPWSNWLREDQSDWGGLSGSRRAADECEEENEHGGDILDQPHDGEDDAEPNLGWAEGRIDQALPYVHFGDPSTDREGDDSELEYEDDEVRAAHWIEVRGMPSPQQRVFALSAVVGGVSC